MRIKASAALSVENADKRKNKMPMACRQACSLFSAIYCFSIDDRNEYTQNLRTNICCCFFVIAGPNGCFTLPPIAPLPSPLCSGTICSVVVGSSRSVVQFANRKTVHPCFCSACPIPRHALHTHAHYPNILYREHIDLRNGLRRNTNWRICIGICESSTARSQCIYSRCFDEWMSIAPT